MNGQQKQRTADKLRLGMSFRESWMPSCEEDIETPGNHLHWVAFTSAR